MLGSWSRGGAQSVANRSAFSSERECRPRRCSRRAADGDPGRSWRLPARLAGERRSFGRQAEIRSVKHSLLAVMAALLVSLVAMSEPAWTLRLQESPVQAPPVPFEDPGACPFEGCVYREWTTRAAVDVRTARRTDAPVAFSLRAGEKVTAVTGVVITLKAGRVQFREPRDLNSSTGQIHIEPGQTLYLLTYQGEGFTKAWFNGRLYRDVDTVEFYNAVCDMQPGRCAGKILEKSQTEWWVQVRNRLGIVGWTNEPDKFDGKNALAGKWYGLAPASRPHLTLTRNEFRSAMCNRQICNAVYPTPMSSAAP